MRHGLDGDRTFELLELWDRQDSSGEIDKIMKNSERLKIHDQRIGKNYSSSKLSLISLTNHLETKIQKEQKIHWENTLSPIKKNFSAEF